MTYSYETYLMGVEAMVHEESAERSGTDCRPLLISRLALHFVLSGHGDTRGRCSSGSGLAFAVLQTALCGEEAVRRRGPKLGGLHIASSSIKKEDRQCSG